MGRGARGDCGERSGDRGDRSRRRSSSSSGSRRRLPGSIPVACAASPGTQRSGRSTTFPDGESLLEFLRAARHAPVRHGEIWGRVVEGRRGVGGRARRLQRQRVRLLLEAPTRRQRFDRGSSVVGSASSSRSRSRRSPRPRSRITPASAYALTITLTTGVSANDARNPRPLRGDDDADAEGEQDDPGPAHDSGFYAQRARRTRQRRARRRPRAATAQPSTWSLTRPIACMNA